ncbi:MAG: hypothetical protein HKP09_09595 [Enterobacterales bacterium]|nr:hypothetical protein [Enterobacterales bacterium]
MKNNIPRLYELIRPLATIGWRVNRTLPSWFTLEHPIALHNISCVDLLTILKARNECFIELEWHVELEKLWLTDTSIWPELAINDQTQLAKFWRDNQTVILREMLHSAKLQAEQDYLPQLCTQLPEIKPLAITQEEHFTVIDPGSRSGIKLLTANAQGEEVSRSIIFPHEPQNQWQQGLRKFSQFVATTRAKKLVVLEGEGYLESRRFLKTWLKDQEDAPPVYSLPATGLDILCQRASAENLDNLYLRATQAARLATLAACCFNDIPLQSLLLNPLKTTINPWLLETALRAKWQDQISQPELLSLDPLYSNSASDLSDLKPGQKVKGRVINRADFGCFLDIGIEFNGLLHNSQDAQANYHKEGEIIELYVAKVNLNKSQFSLSLHKPKAQAPARQKKAKQRAPGNSAMADALQAALKKQP